MEADILLMRYLSDNERYADLVNGFAGKQILTADMLTDMNSQTGFYSLTGIRKRGRQKYRDLIRKAAFGINFVVIGIENQEEVNYLMPLRTMIYDAGEYERQAAKIKKKIRKQRNISSAEFLSGFGRDSRLHPCITVVLFYGEEWDGSKNLLDLMDFNNIPEELKGLVNDYKMHLISVRDILDTSIFKTDLKQVFDFIRHSREKKELRELVQKDAAFRELDEDAYDVMVAFTHATELTNMKKSYEQGGKVNMCQALTELLADERQDGRLEGKLEGRLEGRLEGIKALILDNLEEGKGKACIIAKLLKRFELTEEAAEEYYEQFSQEN